MRHRVYVVFELEEPITATGETSALANFVSSINMALRGGYGGNLSSYRSRIVAAQTLEDPPKPAEPQHPVL